MARSVDQRARWTAAWVVALVSVLAACGDDPEETTSAASSTTATTEETTTTSAPETTIPPTTSTSAAEPSGPIALTAVGLGPIRIGMSIDEATATGLVGEFAPGCEVRSPRPLNAPLLQGLEGSVEVDEGVVTHVSIGGGGAATDPGDVAPGDLLEPARDRWEAAGLHVEVDEAAADVFGVWFVQVTDGGEPIFGTVADPGSGELGWITAPTLSPCE